MNILISIILQVGLLIGTYGERMYSTSYDQASMSFGELTSIPGRDCSYLARMGDRLFAVSEGSVPGAYAFGISEAGLAQQAYTDEVGRYPCYVLAFPGTPYVLSANYGDGNVSVLKCSEGKLGRVQTIQFKGSGPVLTNDSQIHARAHQVKAIPQSMGGRGKWLLVTDLGSDRIRVLKYTGVKSHPFRRVRRFDAVAPAGSGPRHMEFNESAGLLYCITELSGEVLTYKLQGPRMTFLGSAQAEEVGAGASADIHLHPSGRWLYVSHRNGNDGVSIFSVDAASGYISKIGYLHTDAHPRNFAFSPDGRSLLVACRDDKCIQVFPMDTETGFPGECVTTLRFETESPVCLFFTDLQ